MLALVGLGKMSGGDIDGGKDGPNLALTDTAE